MKATNTFEYLEGSSSRKARPTRIFEMIVGSTKYAAAFMQAVREQSGTVAEAMRAKVPTNPLEPRTEADELKVSKTGLCCTHSPL